MCTHYSRDSKPKRRTATDDDDDDTVVLFHFIGSIPRAPDQGFRRSPGRRLRRSLQRVRCRGTSSSMHAFIITRLFFEAVWITVILFTHTTIGLDSNPLDSLASLSFSTVLFQRL